MFTTFCRRIRDAKLWGESAIPYMVAAALELEHHGAHRQAEGIFAQMIHTILALNSQKGRGFANPYYGPEQVFTLFSGMDPMKSEVLIVMGRVMQTCSRQS